MQGVTYNELLLRAQQCALKKHYISYTTVNVNHNVNHKMIKADCLLNVACMILGTVSPLLHLINPVPGVSQHLALWTKVPSDPTLSLHHFLSVMYETGGSKMEATSPHSQNHLGP